MRNVIHIDYITEDGKVIHDENEYLSYKDALKMALIQIDNVTEQYSIKKIEIQPWKKVNQK